MFNQIFLIIFLCSFCFLLFQCYEFIQNYDYIVQFNKKYDKYEFVASPSFSYIDKSLFDPNDEEVNVQNKWRCKLYTTNEWYAGSKLGLVLDSDQKYAHWNTELDCINFIFKNFYINYNNPCINSSNNQYCNIYNYFNFT